MARQDMCKLVQDISLSKDEIIFDLGAGSGAQIKQLRMFGYPNALGVDLVGNPPFVYQGDMRDFVKQDFTKLVGLISLRYSLHTLDPRSAKEMIVVICNILRKGGYLYIVTFGKNDQVVSVGCTVRELVSLIPGGMRAVKITRESQVDRHPYPHEHRIIRALFRKEEKKDGQ